MKWRKFFQEPGQDLWATITELLEIAAADYPEELRVRRDAYAVQLFALPQARRASNGYDDAKPSSNLEDVKPAPVAVSARRPHGRQRIYCPEDDDEDEEAEVEAAPEPVKVESDEEDAREQQREDVENMGSDGEEKEALDPVDYETAEQLTRDLENERLLMDQIARIGRKLEDKSMSEDDLYSLLKRLEDMQITTEVLKQTGIGKQVVPLRGHSSKLVRTISKQLLRSWKEIASVWMKSAGSLAKSDSPPMYDGEHGLPSPPLDESDLLAARHMDFNQVLADMEDDVSAGSGQMNGQDTEYRAYGEPLDDRPHSSTRIKKKVERRNHMASSSSPEPEIQVREKRERGIYSNGTDWKETRDRDGEGRQPSQLSKSSRKDTSYMKEEVEYTNASGKPKSSSGYGTLDRDSSRGAQSNGYHLKKTEHTVIRKTEQRSVSALPSKPRAESVKPAQPQRPMSPQISIAQRLEAAKRKLHDRYEEAEAVKKSRTVQVMDLHELPKGGPNRAKHPHAAQKPKLFKGSQSIRR